MCHSKTQKTMVLVTCFSVKIRKKLKSPSRWKYVYYIIKFLFCNIRIIWIEGVTWRRKKHGDEEGGRKSGGEKKGGRRRGGTERDWKLGKY